MNKSRNYLLLAVLTVFVLNASNVLAWGPKGHRIVAEVAYMHMSKKAIKNVDKVLGKHGMVYWAAWADELKSDTIYAGSGVWHYQDEPEGGELFVRYDSLMGVLTQNPKDTDALRFIVHLTGDRYCPCHMAKTSDAGMNKIKVMWFGQSTNMHSVWDDKIIDGEGYSYTEYAQMLEDMLGTQRASLEQVTMEEATAQTRALVHQVYDYQEQWNGNAYKYIYDFKDELHFQLYAAGVRLAQILNVIYQ